MLPYRFALIASPFSNKHSQRPPGNYWGSPWELFPARLIHGMHDLQDLPRITCSQVHRAHRWLFPELDAKKQTSEGHGNNLVSVAHGSSGRLRATAGLWEMKQHVWLGSEKPKCMSKAHWTSLSTQLYSSSATQRCCKSFISAWLTFHTWMVLKNLAPDKGRRAGSSWHLLLSFYLRVVATMISSKCFSTSYLSDPGL